ncbi:MAG: hydantoinase B/oxoprolinase family protein, partial [Methanomassiliicoccales archaeon]|nr:hydantoinase B/oxoprolinase family protein [Methanomassiliicoccales archaeon]
LPDITFVAPAFLGETILGFVAVRAHHADVGGMTPGSLPAQATEIFQEGLRIPPVKLWRKGELDQDLFSLILANVRTPKEREGDLRAQRAAVETGIRRLSSLAERFGIRTLLSAYEELCRYAERRMCAAIKAVPNGVYRFADSLDEGILVCVELRVHDEELEVDFTGSSPQVDFPVNAPFSVTASAVCFAVKAVLDPELPPNDGAWRPIRIIAPKGT